MSSFGRSVSCSACGGPFPVGSLAGTSPRPGVVVCRCCGVHGPQQGTPGLRGWCVSCWRAQRQRVVSPPAVLGPGAAHPADVGVSLYERFLEQSKAALIWAVRDRVALEERWGRSQALVATVQDRTNQEGCYTVASASEFDKRYQVTLMGSLDYNGPVHGSCTCPDFGKRAPWGWCKHRLAAWQYREEKWAAKGDNRRPAMRMRSTRRGSKSQYTRPKAA